MNPRMIGLSGKRGAGKGTVASYINQLYPGEYDIVSFADPLKEVAALLTGENLSLFHSQEGKATFLPKWNMSAGEFLQKLGNGARETVDQEIWIKASFASLKLERKHIHESVRYPNEVEAIHRYGGVVWRIQGDPLKQQGDGSRDDNHPSETSLDECQEFDAVLYNTGSRESLFEQVKELLTLTSLPCQL